MPLSPAALQYAEALEERYRSRIEDDPDDPDYDELSKKLSRVGSLIDTHYKGQRQVDDAGKLTADATTRQPARVGEGDSDYFFEPNVREVQEFFKRNPDALDRLRDKHGEPLRPWAEGEVQAEIRAPMFDPHTQAITGFNVTPAKSHLDQLQESDEPYGIAAEEMYRLASEDATKKGKALKRYRDIKLENGEWRDVIEGGIKKGEHRIIEPAVLGAADAMSAGLASPAYDAARKYAKERQANLSPEEQESARSWGYDPEDTQNMGSSEDVQNRSMPAYITGNLAGYTIPGNPANAAQKIIQEGLKYSTRGTLGRVGISALAGAGANAAESVIGDVGKARIEGNHINVGDVGMNALVSSGVGAVAGGGLDLVGQGVGAAREGYRDLGLNAPLRTMEESGAEASIPWGVKPTQEWEQGRAQQKQDRLNDKLAPRTVAGKMAEDLAPQIEASAKKRAREAQARTAKQQEEYYNHPAYRDKTVSSKTAVDGLVEMANRGLAKAPIDGSIMPMNPEALDEIGSILRRYSQSGTPVPRADAPSIAGATGGVVVDGELANRLYGYKPDDPNYFHPGTDAVVRPVEINARLLTQLEGRIDNVLKFANTPGGADEPVWKEFNARVKTMRDDFELYRDADGKLVEPPPPEPEPFPLADDIPRPEEGRYLAPPIDVHGPTPPKPEGLMGVGPEHRPPIPENPFDPRLPTSRESINPQPTVDVRGDYSEPGYVGPEASPGIGPNYQPPNDPRRLGPPVSGRSPVDVQGTYGEPEHLPPAVLLGPGPRRDAPRFSGASPDALRPNQSVDVSGGDYSQPQRVRPDEPPAVDTPRMPIGMPEQPKALTDDEYSALGSLPGGRNPLAPSAVSEESLTKMAGMERSDELAASGMDEKLFQQEYGKTPPIESPRSQEESATPQQIDSMFQGQPESLKKQAVEALESRGVVPTIDRLHALKVGGMGKQNIDSASSPDFKGESGRRAMGLPVGEEQVAQGQKDYVEEIFAPGREARAAQVEQVRALGEHPEVIEEAIAAVKKVDQRLGPISQEQKRAMVVSIIEKKLGRKIDAEDLIRFGLISGGILQMSTSDDDTGSAVGAGLLSFGFGKGKKGEPEAPKRPAKPTQPTATLDDGTVVRGFSAMRNEQHNEQEAIERAMKKLGVQGDTTLEGRIRTYGQLKDRGTVDQALLDEASHIGKQKELRNTAGANAYDELKDRRLGLGSEGIGKRLLDFFGFRGYAGAEYLAGRHQRYTPPGEDGMYRNPYVREPNTTLGEIQRTLLEDPARRLLDLTGGGPASRLGGQQAYEFLKGDSEYESKEDYEKKQQKKRNKEANP